MILKKEFKQFEQPEEGSHLAVLADTEDLGVRTTPWGPQKQLRFRWIIQQKGKDGRELSVIETFHNSLNENSSLVKAITDLTGTAPEDGFETETLIGINSRLTLKLQKKKRDGALFAKIVARLHPAKGDPLLRVPSWFRRGGAAAITSDAHTQRAPNTAAVAATEKAEQKLETPPESPDNGEWNPADYDTPTSFPTDSDAAGEQAA